MRYSHTECFSLYRFDACSQIARLSGIVTILGGLFAFLLAVMGFIEDDPKSFLALLVPMFERQRGRIRISDTRSDGLIV